MFRYSSCMYNTAVYISNLCLDTVYMYSTAVDMVTLYLDTVFNMYTTAVYISTLYLELDTVHICTLQQHP